MTEISTILPDADNLPSGWKLLPERYRGTDEGIIRVWPYNGRAYTRRAGSNEAIIMVSLDAENLLTASVSQNNRMLSTDEAMDMLEELLKTRNLQRIGNPGSHDEPVLYFAAQIVDDLTEAPT